MSRGPSQTGGGGSIGGQYSERVAERERERESRESKPTLSICRRVESH